MGVAEGTFCSQCLKEGYKCIAWDYDEKNVACCTFHIDREKCPHKNAPRVLVVNAETVVDVEKKKMGKPEFGNMCACGCGNRLKASSRWQYIRGHKQDKGGLPNERLPAKVKSHSEMTISQLIAKFDAEIAELQRVKELLVKYSGGL
jgi:hypothetical protein